MSRMGGEEWVRRRGVVAGAATGVDRASRKVGKEEMTTAGVGRREEEEEDEEERGEEEEEEEEEQEEEGEADSEVGGGWMAEMSTSREEAEGVGTTRVRPSNPIV
jgi:hypothetical protein